MRRGYFGGTFDPPHRAHLAAALLAADSFQLGEVLFAPTGRQPLKSDAPEAPFEDRFAMCRLLCQADARLTATDLDAPHADGAPNYTVDMLQTLYDASPGDDFFSIVGIDAFLTLPQWREPDRLLALADWIVLSRPDVDLDGLDGLSLTPSQRARVHLLTTLDDDTSATGIRERLHLGIAPGPRLTTEVMLYISRLHLYHPAR